MSEERSLQRFPIEQLGGVNRNLADGLGTAPDELKNLRFTRAGGWQFYGQMTDLATLPGHPNVAVRAVDESGYYAWIVDFGDDYFFDGNTLTNFVTEFGGTPLVFEYVPHTGVMARFGEASQVYFARRNGSFSPVTSNNATVTISAVEDEVMGVLGVFRFAFIHYVITDMGKVLFHPTGSSLVDDIEIDMGGTSSRIEITRTESDTGLLVYLKGRYRFTVIPPEQGFQEGIGEGQNSNILIADFPPMVEADTVTIDSDNLTEFPVSSDLWIRRSEHPVEYHQGRYYYATPRKLYSGSLGTYALYPPWHGPGSGDSATLANLGPFATASGAGLNTIYFTELGFANLTKTLNYFKVPFSSSTSVVGMASTPAGLLIIGQNEMFLFRGDPTANPELVKFASSIGADSGDVVVKMAGIVFLVYSGHIYMISLGMGDVDFGSGVARVSDDIYDVEDPFIELAVDHPQNILVARTASNRVFHFDVARQAWFEGPMSGVPFERMLPNANLFSPDDYGPSYLLSNGHLRAIQNIGDGTARFGFEQLDFGDKRARKLFRSAEINVSDEYNPGSPPVMEYAVDGRSGSVNGSNLGEGRWVFRLPLGSSGAKADFAFSFSGLTVSDVIEPPIVFNVVPSGRRRI